MLEKQAFKKLPIQEKINQILELNKAKIITRGSIDELIYLVDSKEQLHVVPIDNKKYLIDREYKEIFRDILKSIIEDFAYEKKRIVKLFYIIDSYYSPHFKQDRNINLDVTFNKKNANESLILYIEDKLNMNLKIYDKISGEGYCVVSKDPIKELDYCKLDPDDDLKGALTNIIR
jgi:hypothetical protein